MRCGKEGSDFAKLCVASRNPRECAVAKAFNTVLKAKLRSRNPRECAVAKGSTRTAERQVRRRNPRECAVAKSRHCCARTRNSENMNYVLRF